MIHIRTTKEDIEEWKLSGYCSKCPIQAALERIGYSNAEVDCEEITLVTSLSLTARIHLPQIVKAFVEEVDLYASGNSNWEAPLPIEFEIPDPFTKEME